MDAIFKEYIDRLTDEDIEKIMWEKGDIIIRDDDMYIPPVDLSIFFKGRCKRRNRRRQVRRQKKHLKFLSELHFYPCPAFYKTFVGSYRIDRNKENCYYQRCYRGKHSSYLKKRASKAARRYNGDMNSGSMYKKTFDFWWELT